MRLSRALPVHSAELLLLVCCVLPGGNVVGEDPHLKRLSFQSHPAIEMLKQIEDRVLPLPLVDGSARHETLSDYYWDANRALKYQLDEAVRAYTSGKPRPFRALTAVAGSAGVGKTFVKRGVYSQNIPDDQIWKFDLRELLGEFAERGLAVMRPDLTYRDQVINRLLTLTPEGRKEFSQLLETRMRAFAVADSLDEIHPDDYSFVLDELERVAIGSDREFVHVVVFGRPFAFREYWQVRRSQGLPYGFRGFVLNPPDFRTTGDLRVSTWNYACFKYGLCYAATDGDSSRPMSFAEYERWSDQGFGKRGEFANLEFRENRYMGCDVRDELERLTRQSRIVMSVFPNLAANTILREIVEASVESGSGFHEREFMNEFFERWLERDTASDNRPSRKLEQHLPIYLELLEAVAAKYIKEDRVDRYGYFDVLDDDHVEIKHGGETVSVLVPQLLNRSGLVTSDPAEPVAQRYRFEPLWIHRLLFQRHLDREQQRKEATHSASFTADIP